MKELITKIDFFSGLDERILKRIADACIMRQYTKNETIVRQGEMGLGVYVISRGHVRVDRDQGGKKTQLAELGPEQSFGEMSLLDNKPRSATVTATEDTECLLLTRDSFVKLMNKYPEIPIRMARVLAERLRVANEKLSAAPAAAPADPGPAPVQSATGAAAPSNNGSAPPASAAEEGTKKRIEKALIEAFSSLYTMKAMTRFSVAVLGCPVQGLTEQAADWWRVGDVKVYLFPAGEPALLRIQASAPGEFSLRVFHAGAETPVQYLGVAIRPEDDVTLRIGPRAVSLQR